ncbi:Centromere-associated protein E [Nymphon striatum]|nr:Centromere-associated protein E [Nymphon striatum]
MTHADVGVIFAALPAATLVVSLFGAYLGMAEMSFGFGGSTGALIGVHEEDTNNLTLPSILLGIPELIFPFWVGAAGTAAESFIDVFVSPHLTDHFKMTTTGAGCYLMTYGIVSTVLSPVFGYVLDKKGYHEHVLIIGSLMMGIGQLLLGSAPILGITPSIPLAFSSIVIAGVCIPMLAVPITAVSFNIAKEQNQKCKKQWKVEENSIMQVDSTSPYIFDKVYDSEKQTLLIYEEMAKPIAESVIQGFNGTIFAYGQTSSGKTYTMMGDKNSPGIIGLTIDEIFEIIENTPDRMFLLRVSYLEIYNESISDLISDSKKNSLKIHENREGEVYVADLREESVNSPEQILTLMRKGEKNRHFGVTSMNEKSSRSHTIFRMIIESRKRDAVTKNHQSDDAVTVSQLNLVDLAGSERSNQTGNTGERFKEGCSINLSLLTLSQVIRNLSEGQTFINFRGSNLTRILQSSVGGNARTVIICTVTPAEVDQTHSTLKFASRAKTIKNKPRINEVVSDEVLLKKYNKKIADITLQLELEKGASQNKEKLLEEKERRNEALEEQIRKLREKLVVSSQMPPSARILCDDTYKQKKIRRETWSAPLKKKRMSLAFNLGREYLEQSYSGPSSWDGQDDNDIFPSFSSPFTSTRSSPNFIGMAPDLVESELRFSEQLKLHEMSPIPAKPYTVRRIRWGGVSSYSPDEVGNASISVDKDTVEKLESDMKSLQDKYEKSCIENSQLKIESERLTEENIKLGKDYKELQEFTRLEVAVDFQGKPEEFNSFSQEIPGLKAHIKILEDSCANFENLYENTKREVAKKSCEIAEMNNKIECMVKVYDEHEEDTNIQSLERRMAKEEKDLLERLKNENVELTVKYDFEISRCKSRIDELLSLRTLELEITVNDLNKKLADEKEESTNQLEILRTKQQIDHSLECLLVGRLRIGGENQNQERIIEIRSRLVWGIWYGMTEGWSLRPERQGGTATELRDFDWCNNNTLENLLAKIESLKSENGLLSGQLEQMDDLETKFDVSLKENDYIVGQCVELNVLKASYASLESSNIKLSEKCSQLEIIVKVSADVQAELNEYIEKCNSLERELASKNINLNVSFQTNEQLSEQNFEELSKLKVELNSLQFENESLIDKYETNFKLQDELKAEMENYKSSTAKMQSKMKDLENNNFDLFSNIEAIIQEKAGLESRLVDANNENTTASETILQLTENIRSLEKEKDDISETLNSNSISLALLKDEKGELEKTLAELKIELANEINAKKAVEEIMEFNSECISKLATDKENLETALCEIKMEFAKLNDEKQLTENLIKSTEKSCNDLKIKNENLETALCEIEMELAKLNDEKHFTENLIKSTEKSCNDLKIKNENLETALCEIKMEFAKLNDEKQLTENLMNSTEKSCNDLKIKNENLETALCEIKMEFAKLNDEKQHLESSVTNIEAEIKKENQAMEQRLVSNDETLSLQKLEKENLETALCEIKMEFAKLNDEKQHLEWSVTNIEAELTEIKKENQAMEQRLVSNDETLSLQKLEKENLETALCEIKMEFEKLNDEKQLTENLMKCTEKSLNDLKNKNENLEVAFAEIQAEQARLQSDYQNKLELLQSSNLSPSDIKWAKENPEVALDDFKIELEKIKTDRQTIEEVLASNNELIKQLNAEKQHLESTVTNIEAELTEIKQENQALEQRLVSNDETLSLQKLEKENLESAMVAIKTTLTEEKEKDLAELKAKMEQEVLDHLPLIKRKVLEEIGDTHQISLNDMKEDLMNNYKSELNNINTNHQVQIDSMKNEVETYLKKINDLKNTIEEMSAHKENHSAMIQTFEEQIKRLENEFNEKDTEFEKAKSSWEEDVYNLALAKSCLGDLETENENLKQGLAEAKKELAETEHFKTLHIGYEEKLNQINHNHAQTMKELRSELEENHAQEILSLEATIKDSLNKKMQGKLADQKTESDKCLQAERSKWENQSTELVDRMNQLTVEIAKCAQTITDLRSYANEKEKEVKNVQNQLAEADLLVTNTKEELKQSKETISSLEHNVQEKLEEIQNTATELEQKSVENKTLQYDADEKVTELETFKKVLDHKIMSHDDLEKKLEKNMDSLEGLKDKIVIKDKLISQLELELKSLQASNEDISADLNRTKECAYMKSQHEQLENKMKSVKLEELLELLKTDNVKLNADIEKITHLEERCSQQCNEICQLKSQLDQVPLTKETDKLFCDGIWGVHSLSTTALSKLKKLGTRHKSAVPKEWWIDLEKNLKDVLEKSELYKDINKSDIEVPESSVTSFMETVQKVDMMQEWYDDMLERARNNAGKLNAEKNEISKELEEYKSKGLESKMLEEANKKIDTLEDTCFSQRKDIGELKLQIKANSSQGINKMLKEKLADVKSENEKLTEKIAAMELTQETMKGNSNSKCKSYVEVPTDNVTSLIANCREGRDYAGMIDQLENTCVQLKSEISALKSQAKETTSRTGDKALKEKIKKLTANNQKLTETITEMKIKLTSHEASAKVSELNNALAKSTEELMAVSLKNVNLQRETLNTERTLKKKIQGIEKEIEIRDKKIRSLKTELRRKQDLEATVTDSNESEASIDSESRQSNVNIGSGGGSGIVQSCLVDIYKNKINKLERDLLKYKHTSVQNLPSTFIPNENQTSNKRTLSKSMRSPPPSKKCIKYIVHESKSSSPKELLKSLNENEGVTSSAKTESIKDENCKVQ